MKKAIQFMLLAALVVSVSGCANTNHPQAIRESSDIEALRSEIDENAVPKETLTDSFSESKTSSDDSVIDVKAETESSQAETPQPTAEQSPALGIQSPQTVVSNDTPKPESSKAVEPTIAAEKLARIFEQFYRLDAARSSNGGAGLGLAIAKQIVELHGGRIDAESANNTVEFTVTLPLS